MYSIEGLLLLAFSEARQHPVHLEAFDGLSTNHMLHLRVGDC